MKKRLKKCLLAALVCLMAACAAMTALAASADPVYTEITGLEGKISVSSELNNAPTSAWELSKLSYGDRGDFTFQWGWTVNSSADEWILIDLGEEKNVGKVVLHNGTGTVPPGEFAVESGKDNASWTQLGRFEAPASAWKQVGGLKEFSMEFDPVATRYLKIRILKKGMNGANWLIYLCHIQVFASDQPASDAIYYQELSYDITAETLDGFNTAALKDGITADQTSNAPFWSGAWGNGAATDTDSLLFDLGEVKNVGGISIFPRVTMAAGDAGVSAYGFPKAFSFSYSVDGVTYFPFLQQSYTDYQPDLSWNDFRFRVPANARYVKMDVTERSEAGGAYLTQFAEIKIFETDYVYDGIYEKLPIVSATSSGNLADSEGPEKAIDGNAGTVWTASWGFAEHEYADEWLKLDLGEEKIVGKVILRVGSTRQPKALRILGSADDETWATLYDGSVVYEGNALEVKFASESLRYVKVEIFKKGMDGANYLAALAEVEVYASVDDETPAGSAVYYRELTPVATAACSEFSTNTVDKLTDGITANKTASSNYWMTNPAETETVESDSSSVGFDGFYFALGDTPVAVDRFSLFPRFDDRPGYPIGFPKDFRFVWSDDGQIWYQVPGAVYRDYAVLAGWNEFVFEKRVAAKYIGLMVEKRGKNGELYTVELSEARVSVGTDNRAVTTERTVVLDTSVLTVLPFEPELSYFTYEEFRLKLSDYFSYSLDLPLVYEAGENGEIEEIEGEAYFVFLPKQAGSYALTVTCYPQGKEEKAQQLSFALTAVSKDDPDVILLEYAVSTPYGVGVTFRVDCSELFLYEGTAKLTITSALCEIVTEGSKTYAVYKCDAAGTVTLSITATPEGKADKAKTAEIELTVTEMPTVEAQPPVYRREGGCGSVLGAEFGMIALVLVGAAVFAMRKSRKD